MSKVDGTDVESVRAPGSSNSRKSQSVAGDSIVSKKSSIGEYRSHCQLFQIHSLVLLPTPVTPCLTEYIDGRPRFS